MTSPLASMFTPSIVTFAVCPASAAMVMVLSVVVPALRWDIFGVSSATAAPPPCDTVCPLSIALMVMSPSSMYQSAANAVAGIKHTSSSSAVTVENSLRFFM